MHARAERNRRRLFRACSLLVCAAFLLVAVCNGAILAIATPHLYEDEDAPTSATVLVLGARVHPNAVLSDMLADRMRTALDLYHAGKAERFLLSGDHGTENYDEVNAMKGFLLREGVPAEDIFLDHAGFDTFDSMYRARAVFQADSVTVVTQAFHLPRAVFLARAVGLDAIGVVADRQHYVGMTRNRIREALARVKACMDIALRARPKYLGEPIPLTGDARRSWDGN